MSAALQSLLAAYDQLESDLAAIKTDPGHDRERYEACDEEAWRLLRLLVKQTCEPAANQPCAWCCSDLRWHPGIGRWQGSVGTELTTWTDRCPISTDHLHDPAPQPAGETK